MDDAERGKIFTDERHHGRDAEFAEFRKPGLFPRLEPALAIAVGNRFADIPEIIPRIEPVRYRADILAQRLAVPQKRRLCQHIDLCAGIVDIIFPRHIETGLGEEPGEGIADDRAPPMAHMHGAGRVGRDIFHIYRLAGADG